MRTIPIVLAATVAALGAVHATAQGSDPNLGRSVISQVQIVLRTILDKTASRKNRAVAIGAILYFINPFDLIPDAAPVIGYLDDLAVLALTLGFIARSGNDSHPLEGTPQT